MIQSTGKSNSTADKRASLWCSRLYFEWVRLSTVSRNVLLFHHNAVVSHLGLNAVYKIYLESPFVTCRDKYSSKVDGTLSEGLLKFLSVFQDSS